jgi:hypothetical protein
VTGRQMAVASRAQLAAWRGHLTATRDAATAKARRHASPLLIICGAAGLLGGAAIVGTWLLGLTLMAESAFACYVGLNRDDGTTLPARGARTVDQVLEDERLRP